MFSISSDSNKRIVQCLSLILCVQVLSACILSAQSDPTGNVQHPVKNVIIMINDGAGWGTWDATAYWQYGSREGLPYADFPVRYGMTTYPLHPGKEPTHDTVSRIGYDPAKAWDITPTGDDILPFAGYHYLDVTPTDSAAAGTALASGVKTYNSSVNYDNFGKPVAYSTLLARAAGKATGVVTSVPFVDATPAVFAAQNKARYNYHEIARQMLSEGNVDLIMGTGAPGHNVNGTPCAQLTENESQTGCDNPYLYLAQADWDELQTGQYLPHGSSRPWKLIRDKSEFQALADGVLIIDAPLIGIPEIANTLQEARQAHVVGTDTNTPSGLAYVHSVPTLETMTRGALRYLQRRSDAGIFMMIEGGATDWAAHTSNCDGPWNYGACSSIPEYDRLIEETLDFNNAISAVIEWVETSSNWEETLLIITTDHGNGMPMGSEAQQIPFQPVINRGKGQMPGITFRRTGDHSNALVPLWAKGAGSEQFSRRVRGIDPEYARHVRWNDGTYVDNTDVAAVVMAVLEGREVERVESKQMID